MQTASTCNARVRWDLVLHPPQLQAAYWRDHGKKFMQWDLQVVCSLLTLCTVSYVRHTLSTGHVGLNARVYLPAMTVLSAWWLLAKRRTHFYTQHRIPLVLLLKSVLALGVLHITHDSPRLLYKPHQVAPSAAMLAFQTAMIGGVVHLPALCVGLALPFRMQLAWALWRAAIFMLGLVGRELVMFSNTQLYQQGLSTFNQSWARLVQSGQCCLVSPAAQLTGRSVAMTVALLTMHISAVAVSMYLAYLSQWWQVRQWLRDKACRTPPGHGWLPDEPADIEGVLISRMRLLQLSRSPGAALLLDGYSGALGRASLALLHAGIVNALLFASALLSQILVLWVGPATLPRLLLDYYYPPSPGVGGDMCRPEDAPQFVGWVGSLVWALGPRV